MLFLVNLSSPKGSYVLGFIESEDIREAQSILVQKLVKLGIPLHSISQDVVGRSSVTVGTSTFDLFQIPKFEEIETFSLAALL